MEEIKFSFEGALSDQHLMDFYEAGRFQYGAARLMVKLDQFRRNGRFSQKVTYTNNTRLLISSQREGSFLIATLAPLAGDIAGAFLQAPISLMWSFVADRLFKPVTDDNVREALRTQQKLIDVFEAEIAERGERDRRTLELLEDERANGRELNELNSQLYERLIAETERRAYLQGESDTLRRITPEQESKLVSMAAPLMKDMGVALRSSASTLKITSKEGSRSTTIVFANREMTQQIETEVIDDQPTLILVKIVQYNTETGWGKLRTDEHVGLLSFVVPSDRKHELQRDMLNAMDEEYSYIECIFVRTNRGFLQRSIVMSIKDIEAIERGDYL